MSLLVLVLSTLLAIKANAQCIATGFTQSCDAVLSSICFNSETYDNCVNNAHAPCNTDFVDPCKNICNNYYNDLQSCIAENGTGQSKETEVLKAWLATCRTFLQTMNYNDAYSCWLYGGTYCSKTPLNPASIRIYGAKNCKGAYGICRNVTAFSCCSFTNKDTFQSAKFVHIPANAVGGTFKKNATTACASYTASKQGSGCVNGKNGPQNGAEYQCCVSTAGLTTDGKMLESCKRPVIADIAVIDGHYFNMGVNIPIKDSAAFHFLIQEDVSFHDIPLRLKAYEIHGL